DFCKKHDLALIGDEVFADYPLTVRPDAVPLLAGDDAGDDVLTFSLGGLSKSAGLPQVKLGWIAVNGPRDRVERARQQLEVICDTYLSVSTPAQLAAPRLIEAGRLIRASILARITNNLRHLRAVVSTRPSVLLLEPEGGWSAVLRVPAIDGEERMTVRLLEERGVLVHPGYFFDFATEA